MTKVIRNILRTLVLLVYLATAAMSLGKSAAQGVPGTAGDPAQPALEGTAANHPAETLYLQLRSVGLDKSRVYRIRDGSFDRAALHITLEDGTIGFTEDVAGRVTGAFFEGDGEVLLIPPNQVERASMALFTGAAILEERFVTAYFRFNDNTFSELQSSLRPAENGEEFASQWNQTASNLAEADGLRLLMSFSRLLPTSGPGRTPVGGNNHGASDDRFLHARMQGRKLGAFDLYFDSRATEQIWAGQLRTVKGESYYDVWTLFSLNPQGKSPDTVRQIVGAEANPDTIRISNYTIQAEVRPPTALSAAAFLQMDVHQGGERAALFELSRFLQVKKVEADGRPVEFIHNQALEGTQLARRGNDLVAVIFPEPLQTGQRIKLRFDYGGDVLSEAGGGLLYVGARGTWYPNRGMAMSNFDLEFRYPTGWTLVATGKRVDAVSANAAADKDGPTQPPPPGEQVTRWVSECPIPLAGFNLGKYSRGVAHAGSVSVETYAASGMEHTFPKAPTEDPLPEALIPGLRPHLPAAIPPPPPSPAQNAQKVAETSARAIEFFARRFGPYPYSQLALTQMPGHLSQGWPGLIFLSSFSFLTPTEKAELHMSPLGRTLTDAVIAHETAHQWWGDSVAWSGYGDQWIMEALANYSSLMLLQSADPSQFHAVMDKYREDLLQKQDGVPLMEAGPVTLGGRLSCSHFPGGYEAISYGRGTWLFHMLRYMMSDAEQKDPEHAPDVGQAHAMDEPFVRALRKIRERYQGKSISTRELLRVFEEELPPSLRYDGRKSLDWFYQGWVNGTAIPRLELQGIKYSDKRGSTAITGTIVQKLAPNDLVTSVPVYASRAGKNVLLGRVFADGAESQFHLTAPEGTRRVVLDPNQTLLVRIR